MCVGDFFFPNCTSSPIKTTSQLLIYSDLLFWYVPYTNAKLRPGLEFSSPKIQCIERLSLFKLIHL